MPETPPTAKEFEWAKLLRVALFAPGSVGNTYNRFYNYSFANQMMLLNQSVLEPVATYKRWQSLGRQVLKGSRAKEIIRPITITLKDQLDDEGKPKTLTRFKPVRCLFGYSDTEGEELPPAEPQSWHLPTALERLDIRKVPFRSLNGNVQGYSLGREIAVNPVAPDPLGTTFHELGHVVLGHTAPASVQEYRAHRGIREFQAEATSYLAMNELEVITEAQASESRAYIQGWLQETSLGEAFVRQVFTATDTILKAGIED